MESIDKERDQVVYKRPELLLPVNSHYCPGCSHSTIHKLVAQVIGEMGVEDKTIGVSPVGCAVFIYNYINIDWVESAHGRAPAVATAINRLNPGKMVFTYQGDGELGAIGTAEALQACNRGENIAIIFVNNSVFGMTGGQMAPTTPLGMKTVTCPDGRDAERNGFPVPVLDMVMQTRGVCYVSRQCVTRHSSVVRAKAAIRKAFQNTLDKRGTSVIEFMGTCCSGWRMTPRQANDWLDERIGHIKMGDLLERKVDKG